MTDVVGTRGSDILDDVFQVKSNKIFELLSKESRPALKQARHLRLTTTPADDLVEEDFPERVRRLLEVTTSLISLTICIPSMARLHPSNSLPRVLEVLHSASKLHPKCRLGLAVREAEQAWAALPILTHIVELGLQLYRIEFSRAFFPVEALIKAGQACSLEALDLDTVQVFTSSPISSEAVLANVGSDITFVPTLTSLAVSNNSEASPGIDLLLYVAAKSLEDLDLSSSKDVKLYGRSFPHLVRLKLHEDLLAEAAVMDSSSLRELVLPILTRVESCDAIQRWLRIESIRVERAVAGDASEGLVRLSKKGKARVEVVEMAVLQPVQLTPDALFLSEKLVNVGPPIAGDWPDGFGERKYPRLKSITLKVFQGFNHERFVASLDAPNLEGAPKIAVLARKKEKVPR